MPSKRAPKKNDSRTPNPSKPLRNPKQELFAQKVVENKGNISEAYMIAHPSCSKESSYAASSRLLSTGNVRERIQHIMTQQGLSIEHLTNKLFQFTNSENEGIALEATKTGLKAHGAFDENKTSETNIEKIEVVFLNPQTIVQQTGCNKKLEASKQLDETGKRASVNE